ncbi:MAG: hypothetical protein H5T61_14095 [Thermoflexales bacterium]|nr:hypothetical protein [Thermoflexales bacterium]
MQKTRLSFTLVLLALGALIVGLSVGSVLKPPVSSARSENAAGYPTNPTVEALKAELERVTQEELAKGCVEQDARTGQRVLWGSSRERVDAIHARLVEETLKAEQREPEAVARVVARIRSLRGDPSLEVSFQGTSGNPYLVTSRRMEIYQDNQGMMYFVDPATDEVFQFGPGPNSRVEFCLSPQLEVDELRQRAEVFVGKNVPDFQQIREKWIYSESAKGGTSYLFRWEAPDASAGEEMRPFVQVVLSSCGEVVSFQDIYRLVR